MTGDMGDRSPSSSLIVLAIFIGHSFIKLGYLDRIEAE